MGAEGVAGAPGATKPEAGALSGALAALDRPLFWAAARALATFCFWTCSFSIGFTTMYCQPMSIAIDKTAARIAFFSMM